MVSFEKADGAEAARNNERSPQRGSVTGNVNARRYGPEECPTPSRYPREGTLEADDPDEAGEDQPQSDEPDWEDPDIEAHFEDRFIPRD